MKLKMCLMVALAMVYAGGAFANSWAVETPPENEDQMIRGWLHGFWSAVSYSGSLDADNILIPQFTVQEHEHLLGKKVDFTLSPRVEYKTAADILIHHMYDGVDVPSDYYHADYKHRNYVTTQIMGLRPKCGSGIIALGYTSQQFRDEAAVEKALESIQGEWVSTRFLVARFVSDVRLLRAMLESEQDERVLLMLCLRASGYIAADGEEAMELRRLIRIACLLKIKDVFLMRTLAVFSESDFGLLEIARNSTEDRVAKTILLHRMIGLTE